MSMTTDPQVPTLGAHPRPTTGPHAAALALLIGLTTAVTNARAAQPEPDAAASSAPVLWTVVERSVMQDQGGWIVDYRLRYHGATASGITPAEVQLKLEGWVSNSRVAAHALPRWSALAASGATGLAGASDVVASTDDAQRCRERITVQVLNDEAPAEPPAAPAELHPGSVVRVRLKLQHQHVLYGDYDPLLGVRLLELRLAGSPLRDRLPLDREHYLAQARATWPAVPEDRRDPHRYLSAPDSLHLEAHVAGNQYYRFPERPVRYGTWMRLRYWYYIAAGGEGDCYARIAQYRDTPTAWRVLTEGAQDEVLPTIGRWVKVERVFRTEPEATTLALDFRISGNANIGEMWIDDVTLEPVAGAAPGGP